MATFKPKPYKNKQITIRIDYNTVSKIDKLAANFQISRNDFINQCIVFALQNMEDPKTNTC